MTNNIDQIDTKIDNKIITKQDLLIEVGCEELPPKSLKILAEAFVNTITQELKDLNLSFGRVHEYCTPRRLAVLIEALESKQQDHTLEKKGPPVNAGMRDGTATPALLGFAKSCGVDVAHLQISKTDKGEWYSLTQAVTGKQTAKLIPAILEKALNNLPIPKKMRWGDNNFAFVRPVRSLILMLDEQVIAAEIFGVKSGNISFGHRFHCDKPIKIDAACNYASLLETQGFVIVDFNQRQQRILDQVSLCVKAFGKAVIKPELLNEVTALVEWPVALIGTFETRFLDVPQEALISTMQDNQKYFPIIDENGKLLPQFCFISNIKSKDPQAVIHGNERVIRPRFSDAEFFWNTDKTGRLEDHFAKLEKVIFHAKLGSQADKARRVVILAHDIALKINADPIKVERAAILSKCDLLTNMVQEFPELQGIMGRYYALNQHEDSIVAACLEQVYWPKFAGDGLPQTPEACALALAERLDTLVAIFAIGLIPTGSKDPFSLRRNALGVVRILVECNYDLDLAQLIELSIQTMPDNINAAAAKVSILNYILERMRAYSTDFGTPADTFEAVANLNLTRPVDIIKRLHAVMEFRKLEQAAILANANKRISTILRKNIAVNKLHATVDKPVEKYLIDAEEIDLYHLIIAITAEIAPLVRIQSYAQILARLTQLAEPLEAFFTKIMVMCDDENTRNNRLALLALIEIMFKEVADISALQFEGE
ncbi:glycine tRNA synthetase beta subunit [Gammaproteobacteria bacterium]|nr:glycine tRNA synthetase beta subunit [Gammaproteobacteria bacterium]